MFTMWEVNILNADRNIRGEWGFFNQENLPSFEIFLYIRS